MTRMSLLTHWWFSDEDSSRGGTILRMVACALLIVPGSEFLPGSRVTNFCTLLVVSYALERRWTHAASWAAIALLWRGWTTYGIALSYAITTVLLGLLTLALVITRVVQTRAARA